MDATLSNDYQSKLFPYAYNILGSAEDAKDVVQEVMLKYPEIAERKLENETGYLVKSVINKSISLKARARKSTTGVWLPEPIATDSSDAYINSKQILSYSILVLLEHLNPKERAVFILKEGFDYSHEDIAEALSVSIENSRKLLSRARNNIKNRNPKTLSHSSKKSAGIIKEYVELIKTGKLDALEKKLAGDITMFADGGKKINVISEITAGSAVVTELVLYLYERYHKDYQFVYKYINHQPALLFLEDGIPVNCQIFEFNDAYKIRNIYSVVDPDKLKNLAPR